MDDTTRTELEAASFRRLVQHFRDHPEVQNIELMQLADFCRNCLSKWYRAAAEDRGLDLSYDDAREIVYGMPYGDWKDQYQTKVSEEQKRLYEETKPLHAEISGHGK